MTPTATPAPLIDAPDAAAVPRAARARVRWLLPLALSAATACAGAYRSGSAARGDEGAMAFAPVPPTHATFALSGTCVAPPCADVLTARQSRFAMSDGSTWTRVVYRLGDSRWSEWRDESHRRIDPGELPPLPASAR
ncbi:hypothetical protein JQC91_13015 [Jannaschia sp. Os4]|uniref:hypothetical protein n=1 Tax=Jannaschia sp. Os4 TaxID=2807617 RepID=UPI001939C3C1|nr:hypothetical protein [Jannaschia sp. Os4]MBM2577222.1 hypothetical protein [Jannaschia sp. Os4]